MTEPGETTRLLAACRAGDDAAVHRLMGLAYEDLRLAAHRQLRRSPGRSMDTTSLVHEAYLKLTDQSRPEWRDRSHFQAVAAVAMRHILIDYARRRSAQKRGGDAVYVTLDEGRAGLAAPSVDVLDVDEALRSLAALNERLARLVELRYFGGLTIGEAARVLEISETTAKRDWQKARAFLYDALDPPADG